MAEQKLDTKRKQSSEKSGILPHAPHAFRFDIQIPRRGLILTGVLLILLALGVGFYSGRFYTLKDGNPADRLSRSGTLMRAGPWGELDYIRFFIECPDEFLDLKAYENTKRQWVFKGYSPESLARLLDQAQITGGLRAKILKTAQASGADTIVIPERETVFALTAPQRRALYTVLSQGSENSSQVEAFSFLPESFDEYFANSGLSKDTLSLVKKLCYQQGKLLRFADISYVLDTLPDYESKRKLLKTVSRQSTYYIRLRIRPTTDVNALLNYWGRAGYGKDLRPLFEALQRIPEGTKLNLAMALPPWPTARLYSFPFPSYNQPENCHWTSFNFFKDPPDGRFSDTKVVKEKLDSDYYPVFSDPRYGDLVFLTKPNGDIVHSAVFLADDIVYTK
ncbi:MAG: hypothetical protein JWM68_2652, partial [Verrucomicrobiales bacterium]|nr:hypothetical protein [Verrucomicrobiales bacterium]